MALSPREFVEEVEKYANIVNQRKDSFLNESSALDFGTKSGSIDFSDLLIQIREISISLQRLYITQHSINNLSPAETSRVLKKSRLLVLTGILEYFKVYNNKDDSFWDFYEKETGIIINESFYHSILRPALEDESLSAPDKFQKDSVLEIIAANSLLSEYVLQDILFIFKVYRKYFYPNNSVSELISALENKNDSFLGLISGQTSERDDLQKVYRRVSSFRASVSAILSSINSFALFADAQESIMSRDNLDNLIRDFSTLSGSNFYFLSGSVAKARFLETFTSVTPEKFIRFLRSLSPESVLKLPDKKDCKVEDLLNSGDFSYGVYSFGSLSFTVLPNSSKELAYFTSINRDKIIVDGNKIMFRSLSDFTPFIGLNKSYIKPLKIFRNGKPEGFLWYTSKPILDTVVIRSEKNAAQTFTPEDKLLSSFAIRLKQNYPKPPSLELVADYFILLSQAHQNKKINIINTDQCDVVREIAVDSNGIGYSGRLAYPLRNKKPGRVDLFLTHNLDSFSLPGFSSDFTCHLDDNMLFDAISGQRILPSEQNIRYGSPKMYLFTLGDFQDSWVNDSCEVSSFGNFGAYNIYEIDWVKRTNQLFININKDDQWFFSESSGLAIEVKNVNYGHKLLKLAKNQFHSLRDVQISFNKDTSVSLKNLTLRASFNFASVSHDCLFGSINTALSRPENSPIIDELFLKQLFGSFSGLGFGRYEIEFFEFGDSLLKFDFFIIPDLTAEEKNDLYEENDEIVVSLSSSLPCFRNNKTKQSYLFDRPARCGLSYKNKVLIDEKLGYTKVARLYAPFTEVNIDLEPAVISYRFLEDNRLYNTEVVDFYNIHKTSLIVKTPIKDVRLKVNNNVVKPLEPNNKGVISEQLEVIKNYLIRPSNDVSVLVSGRNELTFQVLWNPKVTKLTSEPLFSPQKGLNFSISYEGPVNSYLKLFLVDELSRNIEIKKITCGQDNAPKFVRYDLNKNCIVLTCDGKRWVDRDFTIHVEAKSVQETENLYLKGVYDYNNASFGQLIFRNENFEADIKRLNEEIAMDSENPYLLFERGFIFSEMNQFSLAKENFDRSVELGLDDEEALNYIELFNVDSASNILLHELKQLTYLAQKLYTEELLLEVE